MTAFLFELASRYSAFKRSLSALTGAQEDLLHVHAGLLIFVLASLVLRRKMRSPLPLSVVAFFAVANEVLDRIVGPPIRPMEPWVDIANTIFWPAVLFVLARRWRDAPPADHPIDSS
jgi:hypothetical protein